MRKGVIVLIPFPFTDLSGQKVRPAVVLHDEKKGEDCIVAFISSNRDGKTGFYEIPIRPSRGNGIKVDSLIKVSKIATLQKKIILGELGIVEDLILDKINSSLKKLFNI